MKKKSQKKKNVKRVTVTAPQAQAIRALAEQIGCARDPRRLIRPGGAARVHVQFLHSLPQQAFVQRCHRERADADLEPVRGGATVMGVMLHVPNMAKHMLRA